MKLNKGTFCERTEGCIITLSVQGGKLTSLDLERMRYLGIGVKDVGNEDTIEVTYAFTAEYYNVIEQFSLILNLLDKAYVSAVSTTELKHGKCLIQELLCKLEQLEGKFSQRREV